MKAIPPGRRSLRAWLVPGLAVLAIAAAAAARLVTAQELRDSDRTRGRLMLKAVKKEIQNRYYDPTFHGVDIEARFKKADADIQQATSTGHMFGIIAQAVIDLNDSHTRFVPPSRSAEFEYGWRMRAIGEVPYVIAVKPGSDAAAKGLKAGDRVLSIDGNTPTRQNMDMFTYRYFLVRPVPQMRLVVQSPGGAPRTIEVMTKVEMGKRFLDLTDGEDIWDILRQAEKISEEDRFQESSDKSICIWNMPTFATSTSDIKRYVARLSKYKALVLDLRGNGGGYEDALTFLLGCFFDHDVTVAQPKGRKDWKPVVAKSQGDRVFNGQVIVLVDSETGSAAEMFARVLQLEKRGTVIGDKSAGAVMRSRFYTKQTAGEYALIYGVSITESDVIMTDGQSLENVGVAPDTFILPTAEDIAAGRDPVLARAVVLAGGQISMEEAGKLFPYVWVD
jgi:C-terminal processing protease CtpA/Prc